MGNVWLADSDCLTVWLAYEKGLSGLAYPCDLFMFVLCGTCPVCLD